MVEPGAFTCCVEPADRFAGVGEDLSVSVGVQPTEGEDDGAFDRVGKVGGAVFDGQCPVALGWFEADGRLAVGLPPVERAGDDGLVEPLDRLAELIDG